MHVFVGVHLYIFSVYRIAGYIDIWQIARKRKKIAIGGYIEASDISISFPVLCAWCTLYT